MARITHGRPSACGRRRGGAAGLRPAAPAPSPQTRWKRSESCAGRPLAASTAAQSTAVSSLAPGAPPPRGPPLRPARPRAGAEGGVGDPLQVPGPALDRHRRPPHHPEDGLLAHPGVGAVVGGHVLEVASQRVEAQPAMLDRRPPGGPPGWPRRRGCAGQDRGRWNGAPLPARASLTGPT